MKARYLALAAAFSLAGASIAQAAQPVRPGSAPIKVRPLASISSGARVGAEQPEDASQIFGSIVTTVIVILLIGGGAVIIIGGSSSTPR